MKPARGGEIGCIGLAAGNGKAEILVLDDSSVTGRKHLARFVAAFSLILGFLAVITSVSVAIREKTEPAVHFSTQERRDGPRRDGTEPVRHYCIGRRVIARSFSR